MFLSKYQKIYKQVFKALSLCLLIGCLTVAIATPVWAGIQIKLTDLTYNLCPPELAKNLVLGGGVMAADCYLISGKAVNTSGKFVLNADVFGRVYDANGNDVMPERGRLGSIAEVPMGESDFKIMLSVPSDQVPPFKLDKFKASGFTGKVRR
ncbi:hypothetical protein V2H45_20175 [Tumidithrix elongata RA019]|uniref:Uncharacterized protein n=1 Tax=Tumidithrix elongata BACA0141 TaxID=2716417 RepID=A0AAW9Q6H5_9CYAN|nr:hypothetical protein [Tumidithrix elongata RA019]